MQNYKNFKSKIFALLLTATSGATIQPPPQAPVRPPPPPEPLFVAVPPRPQKLLHSEAYIRCVILNDLIISLCKHSTNTT